MILRCLCSHLDEMTRFRFCFQAQAFYERELEAMKRTQQLTADNLLAWKRTEAELRREFQTQEAALQKTLGKLRAELARVTDEGREHREKSHKLQASLNATESNIKVSLNPLQLFQKSHPLYDCTKMVEVGDVILQSNPVKSTISHIVQNLSSITDNELSFYKMKSV